jgi:hypothetical protein
MSNSIQITENSDRATRMLEALELILEHGDWQDDGTFVYALPCERDEDGYPTNDKSEDEGAIGLARALVNEARGRSADAKTSLRRVRHIKRGSIYDVLGEAEVQISEPGRYFGSGALNDPGARILAEGDKLVVYRDCKTGKLWTRFPDEFNDPKRFEGIKAEPNALVTFTPEAWADDYIIEVDPEGITSWLDHVEPTLIGESNTEATEYLQLSELAPEWVRKWSGPFQIRVEAKENT